MKRLLLFLALILPSLVTAQDSAVIFNEIQYHPQNELTETEWIELKSLSGVDIDLSGWSITGGVNYTFPEGTLLTGRAFILVAATPAKLAGSLGPWAGSLSNSSETLRIRNRNGRIMDALTYSDNGDWPTGADGSGATLARRNQLAAGDGALAWASSNELGGTPGGSNFSDAETAPRSSKLVPINATWKYEASGVAPAANWKDAAFVDTAWGSGPGILYGGTAKMAEPVAPTIVLGNPGANLLGWWPFSETTGTTAANSASGGTAGTLTGANAAFVADGTRGRVLQLNITSGNVNTTGSYVAVGTLPAFNLTNNFTWSAWVKTTMAASTSVIMGNRYNSSGVDFSPREFIKFTNSAFEWHRGGAGENIAYAALSGTNAAPSAWIHMVVVKTGATLTHYRNGVASGSVGITATPINPQPFYMGGDRTVESWSGYLDDVAIWSTALPTQAITGLAAGTYTPATAPTTATNIANTAGLIPADIQFPLATTTELTDDFNAAAVDSAKWTVENQGLESVANGGYNAPTTGGSLTLGGTSTVSYWTGKSLKSISRYSARSQITAKVDRVSLAVTGTAGRSSLWLYADAAHYVHFSHNLNEGGWSYNSRDDGGTGTNAATGGGVNLALLDSFDLDTSNCEMKLVWVPGTYAGQGTVQIYRNGLLAGSQAVTNWPADFAIVLTGQARQAGDSVTAVFDNFAVQKSTPLRLQTSIPMNAGAHYFRTSFNFTGDPSRTTLGLYPILDDGAVFYLNGQEIYRQNMPVGTPVHGTLATAEVVDGFFPLTPVSVPVTNLVRGNNVLSVELHQNLASSPDLMMGAQLQSVELPAPPADQVARVVLNEISSGLAGTFQIELRNLTTTAQDLSRYSIRDSAGHVVTLSGSLAPDGYAVFTQATLGFRPLTNDRVYLVLDGGQLLDAHTVKNETRARHDSGLWGVPTGGGSFGTANSAWALNDSVVINEIFYSAPGTSAEQWIEIYNKGTAAVDLSGWKFADGISFTFPPATMLGAGEYAVVVWDVAAFNALHPGLPRVFGPFNGNMSGQGERVQLEDAIGNPADEVTFRSDGRWPAFASGTGSSLELKNPASDNNAPEAWADSNETARGVWTNVSYTFSGANLENDPTFYSEFIMGLVNDGEVLIDDISVIEDPTGTNLQLIQNGNFSGGTADKWRNIGNHKTSVVVDDPTSPGNKVLKIVATGYTEHMSNHCETSLKNGTTLPWVINTAKNYTISYRARWVRGSNQLHTRLFFNRGARSELLPMATTGGTPGAQNSVYVANAGPTFSGLTHAPAVPAVSQVATVSVKLADANNVASANIFYAVNGAAFTSTAMTAGLNGLWTGTIPGQAASTKVQYYVVATDGLGATSTFPAAGVNSRAMIPWNDSQALLTLPNGCKPHNFRIVMTTADATALHALNDIMSNEYRPCTVIYDEREIYYHCKVHLKSSEHGRAKQPRVGFMVQFAPDELFLGTHDTIAIDRSGAGDQFSQKEIIVKHTLNRANGIPCTQDDLIRVIAPQTAQTGSAILVKTKLDSTSFLDGQFDGGSKGTLFEYELIYGLYGASITGSTTDNTYEGLKLTQDGDVRGVPVRKLLPGVSKEEYRQHWLIKNNRGGDDYSLLMPLLDTLGQASGATFTTNTNNLMDVNQWLRSWAGQIAWGVGDNYASGAQHNALFYTRPGYKAMYFPWDMDFTATNGFNTSVTPNGELVKLIADAANKRLYYGHLISICDNAFNTGYLNRWMTHYSCFLSEDLTSFATYVSQREAYIRGQVAAAIPAVSFSITTNGGNNYTESNPATTLAGNGWVNVDRIRLAGSVEPLVVTWTSQSTWQVVLPVTFGSNVFNFEALNTAGGVIGTDSITVTGTSSLVPADATNLALVEINYNPGGTNPGREFVELRNVSTNTLLLTGLRFIDGIQFTFPSGMQLAPGARILVVDDSALFTTRYGAGLPIAGQFAPSALSNGGELLTLLDAEGNQIFSYAYNDNIKPTDGNGRSLTRVLSATAPLLTEYVWRASCVDGGTPGTTDTVSFAGAPLADADFDGYTALTEYAFGTSDTDPNSHPVPTEFSTTPGQFTVTVDTAACADDVKIIPEYSTDLTTWQPLDGFPAELPLTGTDIAGNKLRNTLGPVLFPAGDTRFYFHFRVVLR